MSEMVDKVAEALIERFMQTIENSSGTDFSASGVSLPSKNIWLGYATAAVIAMREPTSDMVSAGEEVTIGCIPTDIPDASILYAAMIDEALK